jgi:ribosomal protein L40E
MKSWRWPTWILLAWIVAGPIVIAVIAANSAEGRANDYYAAGQQMGGMTWIWIIGIVVLAVVWAQNRRQLHCPRCGYGLDKSAMACPRCGYYPGVAPPMPMSAAGPMGPMGPTAAQPQVGQCPRCGQLVPMTAPVCPHCGYVPSRVATTPEPPAIPPSSESEPPLAEPPAADQHDPAV